MAGLGEITVKVTGEATPEIKALIRQCVREVLAEELDVLHRIADNIEQQTRVQQGVATDE